jgi:phosphoglycolate phosphatase-like HAD superfamily hydrolase
LVPIFDLDGTLLDSDEALIAPFVALGIAPEDVRFGKPLVDECRRLDLAVGDYLAAYDVAQAPAYDGVDAVLAELDRWAVCSNKVRASGAAELARLGWAPEVALFTEDFAATGGAKRLGPVLDALALDPADALFVGDTEHDHRCAVEAGVRFALAGWNPRARAHAGLADVVLDRPADLPALLSARR